MNKRFCHSAKQDIKILKSNILRDQKELLEVSMFKRYIAMPLLGFFLGGTFLSAYPNDNNNSSYRSTPQNVRPGVSEESYDSSDSSATYPSTGREEIAYMDERDYDIHHRANRRGDWGYKQNWRYDREAFYRGETQGEAYDREHPDSAGGIGMDPDPEYLQMRRYYLEQSRRDRQSANSRNNNTRDQRNTNTAYRNASSNTSSDNRGNYRDSGREYYR